MELARGVGWVSRSGICKCGAPARPGQGTCTTCHSIYMTEWRKAERKRRIELDVGLQRLAALVGKHSGAGAGER